MGIVLALVASALTAVVCGPILKAIPRVRTSSRGLTLLVALACCSR